MSFFSAVDKNDRDSADYSTSIRTNHYYLGISFGVLIELFIQDMLSFVILKNKALEKKNGKNI